MVPEENPRGPRGLSHVRHSSQSPPAGITASCITGGLFRSKGKGQRSKGRSKGLLDAPEAYDDFVGISLAGPDEHAAREPLEFGCSGLEFRYRAKVHKLRIHGFAPQQALHHIRSSVSHAGIL